MPAEDDATSQAWLLIQHLPLGSPLGFLARRRVAKAQTLCRQALTAVPDLAAARWGLARTLALAGDLATAMQELERTQLDTPEFFYDLARLALALGNAAPAERWARAAVDARPTDANLRITYAYALLCANAPKRALGVIANVCKDDPEHGGARRALELVRKVLNAPTEAPRTIPLEAALW